MARPKKTRARCKPAVSEKAWAFLNDEPYKRGFDTLDLEHGDAARPLWEQYGDEITKRWIKDHPGTRPSCWWRYTAPKPIGFAPPEPAQIKYLRRFDLLTAWEQKNIP